MQASRQQLMTYFKEVSCYLLKPNALVFFHHDYVNKYRYSSSEKPGKLVKSKKSYYM